MTTEGQTAPETAKLPRHIAERLLRLGYVKIDKSGLLTGHEYIGADELDRVEADTLWLKVGQRADQ